MGTAVIFIIMIAWMRLRIRQRLFIDRNQNQFPEHLKGLSAVINDMFRQFMTNLIDFVTKY